MSDPSARTFSSDFKRFFLRGLVVLLPSVLTLWIVVKAYQFVDSAIAEPINRGVRLAMTELAPYWEPLQSKFDPNELEMAAAMSALTKPVPPEAVRARLRSENIESWWASRWYLNLIGLGLAIVAVYIAGRLLGGFLGRKIYQRLERLLTTVPVVKQVYPYVKQVVDFLLGEDKQIKFNRVVIVEYPRKGLWSLGFQTGGTMRAIAAQSGDSVTVFIPSSPTPFTGYTITVPRNEVMEVNVTVEEALRFVVSGGVLVPDHQLCPEPASVSAAVAALPVTRETISTAAAAEIQAPVMAAPQTRSTRGTG